MTDTSATLKVLSQALTLEQEGRAFYLGAAKSTPNEKGKAMFLSLADDEKSHLEMIQRQLHAVEGEGSYVLLPDLDVPEIDLEAKLFPPDREEARSRIGANANALDALHVALEMEIRSHELYRTAAQQTTDEDGKRMYVWLADAEMTHFNLLMTNYESLVATGEWV